jgi:NAD(P)H-dependent flavin oxidoreductase YrpB (nitropropane dioxygenase family)
MQLGSLRIERPIIQAGLAGGLACHALAAARARTSRPIAVGILLPFAREAHWIVAEHADAVITFWGEPVRRTKKPWIHQCGSLDEALAARDAGADAVVVQGIEAGGHVRGDLPALELLSRARRTLPPDVPLLVAGGMATAADVREALARGAEGAVLGTRFLLSEESRAHAGYKERLLVARRTLLTHLFGLGWPARHRVVPNAATERWAERIPGWADGALTWSARLSRSVSMKRSARMASLQRPWLPLFSPMAPTIGHATRLLDASPLYAGETVLRIRELRPAASLVSELAP